MPTKSARPELDTFDRQLLVALQHDNRTPLRVLAQRVHLSTAAVQRRIRRMEDLGVICANVAVVDPDQVGQVITLLVEVRADRTQTADLDALKRIILVISILHAVFFSVWIYSGSLLKASEDTIVLDVLRGLRNDDKLSDRGDLYNLKRSPWTLGSDVDASGRPLPVGGGANKASSIGRP